jgi:hypothetical protein
MLLAEAVLCVANRVVTVLAHPTSSARAPSLWSRVPAIGAACRALCVARLVFIERATREVDSLMPEMNP